MIDTRMQHDSDVVYYHNDESSSPTLVRIFRRYVQGRVLEVGAGVGFVTRELAKYADSVVACEPTPVLYEQLRARVAGLDTVEVHQQTTYELTAESNATKFDTIVYFSVLEHIEDDVGEIERASGLLADGGHLLILVPAHQWLYAKIDRLSGHYRRYSARSIRSVLDGKFDSIDIRNFDSVGLIPYFVIFRLLRNTSVSGVSASIYSRIVVRLSYVLYVVSRGKPIGKNLVVIARKRS